MVTRLTGQKGVDMLRPIVPVLRHVPMRLVVLGVGEAPLAQMLAGLTADHPDTLAFVERFDPALARLLFAGGDVLLMPSRFEPCGLVQMQAMRYGAIPVVTPVGGLVDTVPDVDASPDGHGLVADSVDPVGVVVGAVPRGSAARRPAPAPTPRAAHDGGRLVVARARRAVPGDVRAAPGRAIAKTLVRRHVPARREGPAQVASARWLPNRTCW